MIFFILFKTKVLVDSQLLKRLLDNSNRLKSKGIYSVPSYIINDKLLPENFNINSIETFLNNN